MTKKCPTASEAVSAEQAIKPVTADMESVLFDVAKRHFGEKPLQIERYGGGRTNIVLGFRVSSGHYVYRMNTDARKVHDYLKEQWAMDTARAAGVATPRVLEVASLEDGSAYMIMERVAGVEARHVADRMPILREMGVLAARLHGVRTRGFGRVFDWSSNHLSRQPKWSDYLGSDFDAEGRLALLQKNRMLNTEQVKRLRASIRTAGAWRKAPVLHHGDLRLKNLIVDPDNGRIRALIDWELCLSSPPPFWDLSISLHELGIDEKEAFLEGYGVKPKLLNEFLPFLRMLNVLNYAHAVRSAVETKDRERLAWLRLRLAGGLELYQS